MQAQHLAGVGIGQQLHVAAIVAVDEGILHGAEVAHVDIHRALFGGLFLGQADGADGWQGEHGAGHQAVIDLARCAAELGFGKGAAFGNGDRRQVDPVRHVAHGPDVVDRSLAEGVDLDRPLLVELHADGIQAQAFHVRMAAGGVQRGAGAHGAAIGAVQHKAFGITFQALQAYALMQGDSGLLQRPGHAHAQVVVEAAQRQFVAVGQMHLRPQARHDAGKLQRDEATANHQQAVGHRLQIQQCCGVHGVFQAGDRMAGRCAAGCDQDALGRMALAVDLHRVRRHDAGMAAHQFHLGIGQHGAVDILQPVDFLGLGGGPAAHVEAGFAKIPAVAARILQAVGKAGGVHHQLLGHAAADHAGAADAAGFGNQHARAQGGRTAGCGNAAGAGANGNQVVVVVHKGVAGPCKAKAP